MSRRNGHIKVALAGVIAFVTIVVTSASGAGVRPRLVLPTHLGYVMVTEKGRVVGDGVDHWIANAKADDVIGIAEVEGALGYWVATSRGTVVAIGTAPKLKPSGTKPFGKIVGIARTGDSTGYWLVNAKGRVFGFGTAKSYKSPRHAEGQDFVAIAAAGDRPGCWVVTNTGRVFDDGKAPKKSTVPGKHLRKPPKNIVGMASTVTGEGYWLATASGTVYNFGAASALGSLPDPVGEVTAIAPSTEGDAEGDGYWLLTTRGDVTAFGSVKTTPKRSVTDAPSKMVALSSERYIPLQPIVNSMSPAKGPVAGATKVTLEGTHFTTPFSKKADVTVTFEGSPAKSLDVVSSKKLTVLTPSHAAGRVTLDVTDADHNGVSRSFTYLAPMPTLKDVSPSSDIARGGSTVAIQGHGFTTPFSKLPIVDAVTFGGSKLPVSQTLVSTTTVTMDTPAHLQGTIAVTVVTISGTRLTVPGGFTYDSTLTPTPTTTTPTTTGTSTT